MDRSQIRDAVKDVIGRSTANIDTVLDKYIDIAVELFGNVIDSVYDEERHQHTIDSNDITNSIDNWKLPSTTKGILSAAFVEKSGTEKSFYPIKIVSPMLLTDMKRFGGSSSGEFVAGGKFNWNTQTPTFLPSTSRGTRGRATRVDRPGQPTHASRIGTNIHVYPRPGDQELGDEIRLLLQVRPKTLLNDTDRNTITDNYPQALVTYVAASFTGGYFRDLTTAQFFLNQATTLLQSFATKDEISKLVGVGFNFSRT